MKRYTDDNEQFVKTDLERIREQQAERPSESGGAEVQDVRMEDGKEEKLALVIKFQLGASQYATMALRELMKTGGTRLFKPEYMGGR